MNINHIWIDADSCPLQVRNFITKFGKNNNIPVTFVANKAIQTTNKITFEMIIVEQKKDSADNYIYNNCNEKDIVITRDILFAEKLVKKNIICINDRGTQFDEENLKKLLEDRDFDMQIANCGLVKRFNEGYDEKKFQSFLKCFNKVVANNTK